MPIRDSGLGIRRVSSLALSAFVAFAVGTLSLQETILPEGQCQQDEFLTTYQSEWTASFGVEPVGVLSHRQSAWDKPGIAVVRSQLESGLVDERQKTTFLAATAPHTGDCLSALSTAACGLRLDDEAVRVAVALCLGLKV